LGPLILTTLLHGAALCGPAPAPVQDERESALIEAMVEASGDPVALHPKLLAAYDAFRAAHDAYRGEAALALAEAMHAHAHATWSAYCLEGILRKLGDYATGDEVLRLQLEAVSDPAERLDLLQRRAILAAGAGWPRRERAYLGAALALGGTDSLQMLGRLALASGQQTGHQDRARILFRVLLERHRGDPAEAPPWALRGWGLALLPPPAEPLRR
jgi:hypothetical protein